MNINTAMALLKKAAEKCPELKPEIDEFIKDAQFDDTDAAYIEAGGLVCPCCKGKEISVKDRDAYAATVAAYNSCDSCGATWTEHFALFGISDLETEADEEE